MQAAHPCVFLPDGRQPACTVIPVLYRLYPPFLLSWFPSLRKRLVARLIRRRQCLRAAFLPGGLRIFYAHAVRRERRNSPFFTRSRVYISLFSSHHPEKSNESFFQLRFAGGLCIIIKKTRTPTFTEWPPSRRRRLHEHADRSEQHPGPVHYSGTGSSGTETE